MPVASAKAMAKPSSRRLKVFQAQFGFYDTVVAAPSQAAALRAWGIHQNLFASDDARQITEAAAVAAALAHPETPLRRPLGSEAPFQLEPAALPELPDAPKSRSVRHATPAAAPQADRTGLDDAEAALRAIDAARQREEAEFHTRQADLDAAKAQARAAYRDRRKKALTALTQARQTYRSAGGRE